MGTEQLQKCFVVFDSLFDRQQKDKKCISWKCMREAQHTFLHLTMHEDMSNLIRLVIEAHDWILEESQTFFHCSDVMRKDATRSLLFSEVDEALSRLNYNYKKLNIVDTCSVFSRGEYRDIAKSIAIILYAKTFNLNPNDIHIVKTFIYLMFPQAMSLMYNRSIDTLKTTDDIEYIDMKEIIYGSEEKPCIPGSCFECDEIYNKPNDIDLYTEPKFTKTPILTKIKQQMKDSRWLLSFPEAIFDYDCEEAFLPANTPDPEMFSLELLSALI